MIRTVLDFQQAVADFQKFLASENISPDIVWIFREDITWHRNRFFVRWPLPKDNWQLAEKAYELGREKGLGLKLEVYCWAGETPCCYVLIPEDETAAECLMMTELRFSYPTKSQHKATKVRFSWLWRLLADRVLPQAVEVSLGLIPSRRPIAETTN